MLLNKGAEALTIGNGGYSVTLLPGVPTNVPAPSQIAGAVERCLLATAREKRLPVVVFGAGDVADSSFLQIRKPTTAEIQEWPAAKIYALGELLGHEWEKPLDKSVRSKDLLPVLRAMLGFAPPVPAKAPIVPGAPDPAGPAGEAEVPGKA